MLTAEIEKVGVDAYPYLIRVYDVTEEEYERITTEDTKYELIDGVLIMHSPASIEHEDLFGFLHFLLTGYVQERRLGKVLGSRATLRLSSSRNLEPDLFFVARANLHRVQRKRVEGTADFVIEVVSRSTRDFDLEEKRSLYREARVREIWFVDRDRREVLVDTLGDAGYTEARCQTGRLESAAIPGFRVEVDWLWQEALPAPLPCLSRLLAER